MAKREDGSTLGGGGPACRRRAISAHQRLQGDAVAACRNTSADRRKGERRCNRQQNRLNVRHRSSTADGTTPLEAQSPKFLHRLALTTFCSTSKDSRIWVIIA